MFPDGGRKGGKDWKEKRKGGWEASDPKGPTLWWRQSRPTQPPRKSATPTNFEAQRRAPPAACAPQGAGPPDPRTPGPQAPVSVPPVGRACGRPGYVDPEGRAPGAAGAVPKKLTPPGA